MARVTYEAARRLLLARQQKDQSSQRKLTPVKSDTRRSHVALEDGALLTPLQSREALALEDGAILKPAVQSSPGPEKGHRRGVWGGTGSKKSSAEPSYLCEATLRTPGWHVDGGVQSTTRCSTITQDMELESHDSSVSSCDTLDDGTSEHDWDDAYHGRRAVLKVVPVTPGEAHHSAAWPLPELPPTTDSAAGVVEEVVVGELDVEYRVVQRIGEPEGLGPAAGRVTALKYCVGVLSLLAAGTERGIVVVIRDGQPDNPLHGHTAQVMDLVWSEPGQCLLSTSLDRTIRIWSVDASVPNQNSCIRTLAEPSVGLCITLSPSNNNMFATGTEGSVLKFYNVSTGKLVKKHKLKHAVGYLAWSPCGKALYVADARGRVTAYAYNLLSHSIKKCAVVALDEKRPVTSLCCRRTPETDLLLANVMASAVYVILCLPTAPYTMTVYRKLAIPQRQTMLRSVFCPTQSCLSFATGSEDGTVWIVQEQRKPAASARNAPAPPPKVMKLQGHQGAVLNVSASQKGMVASGDELGCIMLWSCKSRRAKGGARGSVRAAVEQPPTRPGSSSSSSVDRKGRSDSDSDSDSRSNAEPADTASDDVEQDEGDSDDDSHTDTTVSSSVGGHS